MPAQVVEGGCLCKAVRYRISGEPLATSNCHCRSCRLASGAPSVAWVVVRAKDFSIASGSPKGYRSSPPVIRTFCGKCGTPLTYQHVESPDTIDVTTASFDTPDMFPPKREIWIEHKVSWTVLDDKLPHCPRDSAGGTGKPEA